METFPHDFHNYYTITMSTTIKDVAKQANLSISTVSRAINNSGYVSEDNRKRVFKVMADLDYRPNFMACVLRGKESHLIGLIIPDIFNLYYTKIANSVSDVLRKFKYELILGVNNESSEIDLNYLKVFREKHVDGMIYVHPANGNNSTYVHELINAGIPIVELNRQREIDFLDAILADNFQGAYQMTDYLIKMGHKRIGLIIGESEITAGKYRIAGYRRALKDMGISIDLDLIRGGTFTREHGEIGTQDLLHLAEPPTAIFAGSNRILMGVLNILGQKNIEIPRQISVVAFNDAEWLSIWKPPITVVDIAAEEMARLAVEILLHRIASKEIKSKPVTYQLSTFLIERNSCRDLRDHQTVTKTRFL